MALTSVLLGIDVGTTVLKVAAFDTHSGKLIAHHTERLQIQTDSGGAREQDPPALGQALRKALRQVGNTLGPKWKQLAGIGLAAQGGSATIVNRATGQAHLPISLWNDGRVWRRVPEVAARKSRQYWRALAQRNFPGQGLARLLWWREAYPQLFSPENLYVGVGDYLYFQLTGVWRQDAGNAHQIGCYHAGRNALVQSPLDLVETPLEFFSPLRQGHETFPLSVPAAKLFGLPEGIPVAGPYMDHEAGYLSAAKSLRKPLQCSLGTAWVGNFVLPPERQGQTPFGLILPAPNGPGRLVVQPLLTGNVTFDWGLAAFVDQRHHQAVQRVGGIFSEKLLPPPGLVALPWLNWSNPLAPGKLGAGTFFGVNLQTTAKDLMRALAAGMCYEFFRVLAQVKSSGAVDGMVLGGGASKGAFFQTMLATLFAPLPVYVMTDEDLAGVQGAVFPFSLQPTSAKTALVPPLAGEVKTQLMDGYAAYSDLFNRLYRKEPAGGAFALK